MASYRLWSSSDYVDMCCSARCLSLSPPSSWFATARECLYLTVGEPCSLRVLWCRESWTCFCFADSEPAGNAHTSCRCLDFERQSLLLHFANRRASSFGLNQVLLRRLLLRGCIRTRRIPDFSFIFICCHAYMDTSTDLKELSAIERPACCPVMEISSSNWELDLEPTRQRSGKPWDFGHCCNKSGVPQNPAPAVW